MRIFHYVLLCVLLLWSAPSAWSQETLKNESKEIIKLEGSRPDIPGEFGFDLGFLYANQFPDSIKTDTWRSIYFSPFYKYEFLLGRSNFSILTGVSVTPEKYRFGDAILITREKGLGSDYSNGVVDMDTVLEAELKKTNLTVTYLEIPLEFRIRSNVEYPKRSFFITLGGKIGYKIDSKTKVKYRQEGENKIIKNKQSYDLEDFRFSVSGRIGYGSFNLFYQYSLTQLFQKDKGPLNTEAYPMLFGISFHVF